MLILLKAALLLGILFSILGTTVRSEAALYTFVACAIGVAIIEILSLSNKEPRQ